MAQDLDTSKIREWRSIVALIAFVITSKFKRSYPVLRMSLILPFRHHRALSIPNTILCADRALQWHMGSVRCVTNHRSKASTEAGRQERPRREESQNEERTFRTNEFPS